MYVLALTLAVLLALAGPAAAQDRLPENNSGTDQYVEPVPDAGGDRAENPNGRGNGRRGSLPPGVRSDLPPGGEGRILEQIATDPGSGAAGGRDSGRRKGDRSGGSGSRGGDRADASADPGLVSSIGSAIGDSDDSGLMVVLVGGLALTLLGATLAARRRGRQSTP